MARLNNRTDFVLTETFMVDGLPGSVPDNVKLEYSTKNGESVFVAERDGSSCINCRIAGTASLEVFIPLSSVFLGSGQLIRTVTVYEANPNFPGDRMGKRNPSPTGIYLYDGASDDAPVVTGEVTM